MFKRFKKTCTGVLARKGYDFSGGYKPFHYYDEVSETKKEEPKVTKCETCKCHIDEDDAYRVVVTVKSDIYNYVSKILAYTWGEGMTATAPKVDPDRGDRAKYSFRDEFYCQRCKPVKKVVKKKNKKK